MAVIATLAQLAAYLRTTVDDIDEDSATLILELAHDAVDGVTSPTPTSPRMKAIVLEVAARAYKTAPEMVSENVDDYQYRRFGENVTVKPGVYLTADERAEILDLAGKGNAGKGSVRLRAPWSAWS